MRRAVRQLLQQQHHGASGAAQPYWHAVWTCAPPSVVGTLIRDSSSAHEEARSNSSVSASSPCSCAASAVASTSYSTAAAASASGEAQQGRAQQQQAPAGRRSRLLMREFIHQSLYHPVHGYFNQPIPVVGHLPDPINYWKVSSEGEWRLLLAKKYKELGAAWLTPAELFSPWYGAVLARHIMEHRKHNLGQEGAPLEVIEVGGGNGTLARDILNWLRDNVPSEYARATYTCLEISPRLAAQQYDAVVTRGGHAGRFRVRQADASHPAAWGDTPDFTHCFVLMMEVLDNLPHDKVVRDNDLSPWMQTAVRLASAPPGPPPPPPPGDAPPPGPPRARALAAPVHARLHAMLADGMERGPWVEELEPVTDALIQRALPCVYRRATLDEKLDVHFNKVLDFLLARTSGDPPASEQEILYVPTACLALLDLLHAMRPNHSLIVADFDWLPDVRLPGRNAPLVAEKEQGVNKDHDTVLVPWGKADIFFPTDFDGLAQLYLASAEWVWGGQPPSGGGKAAPEPWSDGGHIAYAHYKQGEVLRRYREMEKTATLLSFNPMVNDFQNTRLFLGDAYGRRQAPSAVSVVAAASTASSAAAAHSPPAPAAPTPAQQQPLASAARPGGATTVAPPPPPRPLAQQSQQQQAQQEPITFAYQWGHGRGMQHAMVQQTRRDAQGRPVWRRQQPPAPAGASAKAGTGKGPGGAAAAAAATPQQQRKPPLAGGTVGGRAPAAGQQGRAAPPPGAGPSAAASDSQATAPAAVAQEPVLGGRHLRSSGQGDDPTSQQQHPDRTKE